MKTMAGKRLIFYDLNNDEDNSQPPSPNNIMMMMIITMLIIMKGKDGKEKMTTMQARRH